MLMGSRAMVMVGLAPSTVFPVTVSEINVCPMTAVYPMSCQGSVGQPVIV